MAITEHDAATNEVRKYTCDSWDDFAVAVRQFRVFFPLIFRGHANPDWKLSSLFERVFRQELRNDSNQNVHERFADGKYEEIRDGYLTRFKPLVVGTLQQDTRNWTDKDWWTMGRHHGLITPLLDWSRSPYIAAYFACMDHAENLNPGFKIGTYDGSITTGGGTITVWGLEVNDDIEISGEFEIIENRIDFAERQRAQAGVFTRLTSYSHLDVESYLHSRHLTRLLMKYEFPARDAKKALLDLELMNITSATLFPGLDGAAAKANLCSLRMIGGID